MHIDSAIYFCQQHMYVQCLCFLAFAFISLISLVSFSITSPNKLYHSSLTFATCQSLSAYIYIYTRALILRLLFRLIFFLLTLLDRKYTVLQLTYCDRPHASRLRAQSCPESTQRSCKPQEAFVTSVLLDGLQPVKFHFSQRPGAILRMTTLEKEYLS
jgi:hypothetical protein